MRALVRILVIIAIVVLVGWGALWLWLPTGQTTTEVTATIELDGHTYTSKAIWLTRAKTQWGFPDSGINFRASVAGDAVAFDLGDGSWLFLKPDKDLAIGCARKETGNTNYAMALLQFRGPCDSQLFGELTHVTMSGSGTPEFETIPAGGSIATLSNPDDPTQQPDKRSLANRGFRLVSIELVATGQRLATDMTQRFPWILTLPRTDYSWKGDEYLGQDAILWSRGTTYAQNFTTYLPTPSGSFVHSLAM